MFLGVEGDSLDELVRSVLADHRSARLSGMRFGLASDNDTTGC